MYKSLLKKYPDDMEIKMALKRLKKYRSTFDDVNESMKEFFIHMKSDDEYRKFEEFRNAQYRC